MSERSEEDTVAFSVENRIAWVKFNRPEKRNCMSPKLNRRMKQVIEDLEFRDDVGVLVLTGEGEAWSAGMDLREYFRETEAQGLGAVRKAQREAYSWWDRLRWYEKPTIAMINGWCFGGGYGPLFACDIAVAAHDAQFGLSEINWGILPGGGASKVAVDLMPLRKALYHAMMGENLTATQAAEQGLITEAVPADRLHARVLEIAEALLKKDGNALRATKWAIRRMTEMTYDNAEDYLIRAQEALHSFGGVAARTEATKQFLDEKTFKPGLGTFDTSKIKG
ncbi:p-hydroxycinnamoyl CoA hydratase/lyase [Novosphingobium sp. FSW06-99]|uniref:p-hydroxycinnamoyl CoA hydratase/lyase n=1 Tax=Novosphingobium sp. FSW06-99 TaxID=1739113 RepID=UPI00076D1C6B|nr:p-hydroxycinnamoyl CoA hydratase/lyase [Novosphingobium sp. FSW06-99]KUR77165.1 p-hydroxycinnamoyl CoA hydratase/lyase [Novosphingobium sp. FSW06-99]